jgi:hypothetical protein
MRIAGLYVFKSTGLIGKSRHVRVPNSVSFIDDAVVKGTVFCGFV